MREALYNIYLSRGPEPQCEALMTGYLYIFMAHLMKEAREAMPNVGSSSSQYVLAAIKYIQFNYSHDISVDDIAKAVGVSRSHLYRAFQAVYGCSPSEYLIRCRLQRARQLLSATALPVGTVAASAGFEDPLYFSRLFRQRTGQSPSAWRESRAGGGAGERVTPPAKSPPDSPV